MISKILITLAVIVACMMVLSARAKPQLKRVPNPETERNRKLMRNAALAFMLLMTLAASVMIYLQVDKRDAVVTVHVINTQSGTSKSYRVKKSEIRSDGFTTIDGVQVFVAAIERIEIDKR
jgi:archaellum biogenesis protein FlaJ (TadC family)